MSSDSVAPSDREVSVVDLAQSVVANWKVLALAPMLVGLAALGASFLIKPTFTARTVFLPPQQQQSAAASVISQLGALSGLAGAATGIKSPIEQYVTLMQSVTVADRMIDRFQLMSVYEEDYRVEARKELARNVRILPGRKDGLISVEVEDESPTRAASMANQYVEELRRLTRLLALTEAQQRRAFFEEQLKQTRDQLARAQMDLQTSGFTAGALKAEPRSTAEAYAKLRAEVTAAEVKLQTLRRSLSEATPEVQQQLTLVTALRGQLVKLEGSNDEASGPGYVGKYREFKYQETLFELFSRQYELARLDESREGSLIQVVDAASPPEKKTRPKRALWASIAAAIAFLAALGLIVARGVYLGAPTAAAKALGLQGLRIPPPEERPTS